MLGMQVNKRINKWAYLTLQAEYRVGMFENRTLTGGGCNRRLEKVA